MSTKILSLTRFNYFWLPLIDFKPPENERIFCAKIIYTMAISRTCWSLFSVKFWVWHSLPFIQPKFSNVKFMTESEFFTSVFSIQFYSIAQIWHCSTNRHQELCHLLDSVGLSNTRFPEIQNIKIRIFGSQSTTCERVSSKTEPP
jgi:hypothetical protein